MGLVILTDDAEDRRKAIYNKLNSSISEWEIKCLDDIPKAKAEIEKVGDNISNDTVVITDTLVGTQDGYEYAAWCWEKGIRKIIIISFDASRIQNIKTPRAQIVYQGRAISMRPTECELTSLIDIVKHYISTEFNNQSLEDWDRMLNATG